MNPEKPSWSAIVKASSFGKGAFSEEMKQTVMKRVEQNQRKTIHHPLFYAPVPLIVLIIIVSMFPFVNRLPSVFQDQHILGTKTKVNSESEVISNDGVILHYETAKALSVIPDTDKGIRDYTLQKLPISSVQVQDAVLVDGIGKYLDYTKHGEDSISYFGFQLTADSSTTDGEIYEIGYGKMSNVNFQPSNAFGISHLRLDGKCGPERRCAYWISINQDKVTAYEQMDASTIYEQDLDGDGVTEVIVLTHAAETYIYKNINGQIESVLVQAALKAGHGDTITYNPDNQVFALSSDGATKSYRYAVGANDLVPLHEKDD